MLVVIASITVLVISKRCAICSKAGATMEEDTGDIKVNEETTRVAAHFCRNVQLEEWDYVKLVVTP